MSNFDFLKQYPQFGSFSEIAIAAEQVLPNDSAECVLNCRKALEAAVKWMYSADDELTMPYQDKLVTLINTDEFRKIVDTDLWNEINLIRKMGRLAEEHPKKVTRDRAELCLSYLFDFIDFVAYCYEEGYVEQEFDSKLLADSAIKMDQSYVFDSEIDFEKLVQDNQGNKDAFTSRRKNRQKTYSYKRNPSEYETRKIYIDTLLMDAGWTEGVDWINEYELQGMPNKAGVGYADYVLFGADGKAIAVIEAKRTCVDPVQGRHQAKLYADLLEEKFGRRPIIFLSNGYETKIIDGQYPERPVAAFYSKRDLEKIFNLRVMKEDLNHVHINKNIAGRYYQEGAIKAVCESMDKRNRRKALLVMATGSGKTRTVIGLVDVLLKKGWVRDVLFLADRNSLVTQAKRSFVNFLPDLSVTNLTESDRDFSAHCVFSTYQTMANLIDTAKVDDEKVYTCGHFDLLICDEAHRSIYNKYKDIFNYFDAPLVGLTATPKDDIDKNTYEVFELEYENGQGVPTYGYDLAQAVNDGFLVDFLSVETETKFIEQGIVYDELTEEEKYEYEQTFVTEDGTLPEKIESGALNDWVFNEDTIRKVLRTVMKDGIKIDYGQKLGKTIIFAKNHRHAEKIHEIFYKEFPHLIDYAMVIDNRTSYVQNAIDQFSDPKRLPQIAISVDMLDTGIDVPEVLNLVFFKKVMSKAKFWQMIGRGTRLCPGLLDGKDKDKFYIFDFCGNFEFFRMNKGKPSANLIALQGALFGLKFDIAYKLQDINYQTDELRSFREELVDDMSGKVQKLDRDNYAVRQHIEYVDKYSHKESYQTLTYPDTLAIREEVAPYILPESDEPKALRFDALMYRIELAYLAGHRDNRARKDLMKKVAGIASVANIPVITAQKDFITKLMNTDYLERAGINEFEEIRERLRNLIKYIPAGKEIYDTNFEDQILEINWNEADLDSDDLRNYKEKAAFYIRKHQDNRVIEKLKSNIPLTKEDIAELENILWSEVGTKQEYEAEYGAKPLGELVREIVGMDMKAAKEAFSKYLDDANLNEHQIYFVNQIVEYIMQNGVMNDLSVLQESPFTDHGSIVELFTDLNLWNGIMGVINQINQNARVAA
ncbi:MAG: DEAD/DEAH box helicase family protein [Firmicutes bacterium]|nr:DEAD/DEAH box helicase family protein [Bacillota bacterium]